MNALLKRVSDWMDPDRALQRLMGSLIDACQAKSSLGLQREKWRPGRPLKLLLAGYSGARNTGADVRVEEMIRQFRSILTDENLEMTLMTVNPAKTAGYFRAVRQVKIPMVYPKFLFEECPKHHGVIACEGSMFKSKFASALSTMMAGALGLATAEGKLSVGYGAEAGEMDGGLRDFVEKYCARSFVLCRNEASRKILDDLGIRNTGGTDTAWTFEPAPRARGAELLRKAGWDGKRKVLIVCPINPFWWPIRPDLAKALAWRFLGEYKKEHHQSIYFHAASETSERKYHRYLNALAGAMNAFSREKNLFPVLVGMEELDRRACEDLNALLTRPAPLFVSDEYDMYELVSVLRQASYLASSRYHAVVTTMPAQVPSLGITMDERLRNLLVDRGHPDLLLTVDQEDLEEKLLSLFRKLDRENERIADDLGRFIPPQLKLMGEMGIGLVREIERVYPEFPRRKVPESWEHFLPSLSPTVEGLLKRYESCSGGEPPLIRKMGGKR
ncbi:MAG: polysaccharide pyruvyl transferase family protein [bacterium]